MTYPAVFLDRDGVINVDSGYVSDWHSFVFLPGVIDAMRSLCDAGYALIIVTNQSGIGRGFYTEEDFNILTERMCNELSRQGVSIAGVYFCPHLPDATVAHYRKTCDCRKPRPGLIHRAMQDLNIDLTRSAMVGDKVSDMQAALAAGIPHRYQVVSSKPYKNCIAVNDLSDACIALLAAD
ncbi:MAG: D-glycero-beta-D-manno-heptose 1,7-bisphosphate 7-phosphatase [Pseudomonadota bacterium]|nr:D-glycero-beta-D-manno-heptose 1,7-bisphosphate 7-phosphatase [Pseudomonadota bacterium]